MHQALPGPGSLQRSLEPPVAKQRMDSEGETKDGERGSYVTPRTRAALGPFFLGAWLHRLIIQGGGLPTFCGACAPGSKPEPYIKKYEMTSLVEIPSTTTWQTRSENNASRGGAVPQTQMHWTVTPSCVGGPGVSPPGKMILCAYLHGTAVCHWQRLPKFYWSNALSQSLTHRLSH